MSQEAGLPPLEGDAHVVRFAPSVDLIAGARQHIKLLWAVHLVKENYLYKDGPVLREALRRYVTRWLPLVKEALGQGIELAPPVDIAWLWHVHRLSPLGYHEDCMSLAGKPLHADAGTNPFAFDADADGRSPTRTMWETLFPEEPFVNRFLSGYPTAAPANADSLPALGDAAPCNLRVDIVSSVQRQSGFLWQVSYGQGYYGTEDFLQAGLLRYRQLMHLMGNHRDVFLVPTYDMDLFWHTHLGHSGAYAADCMTQLGSVIGHDDSVTDRSVGAKLHTGSTAVTDLWARAFPGQSWRKQGGMWRGDPPPEYYEDWRHAVTVWRPALAAGETGAPRQPPQQQQQQRPAVPCAAQAARGAGGGGFAASAAVAVTEAYDGAAPAQPNGNGSGAPADGDGDGPAYPPLPQGTVLGVPAPHPGFTTIGQPARIVVQLPNLNAPEERRCRFLYQLPDALLASPAAGEVLGIPAAATGGGGGEDVVVPRGSEQSRKLYFMLQRDAPEVVAVYSRCLAVRATELVIERPAQMPSGAQTTTCPPCCDTAANAAWRAWDRDHGSYSITRRLGVHFEPRVTSRGAKQFAVKRYRAGDLPTLGASIVVDPASNRAGTVGTVFVPLMVLGAAHHSAAPVAVIDTPEFGDMAAERAAAGGCGAGACGGAPLAGGGCGAGEADSGGGGCGGGGCGGGGGEGGGCGGGGGGCGGGGCGGGGCGGGG